LKFEYSQHTATKKFIKYFLSENLDIDSPQCLFPDPQFSPEEDELIFNYKQFSPCKTSTKAEIVVFNDTIKVKCRNHQEPIFIYDNYNKQILGGKLNSNVPWTRSNKISPGSEFFIVMCGKKSIYSFSMLRFNAKASKEANSKRKDLGWNAKNFNVFILVLDQVSRYSARRNLPKMSELLDGFNENQSFHSKISLYSFEKTPSVIPYTVPNIIPILYGKTEKEIQQKLGKKLAKNIYMEKQFLYQKKYSIWKYYSSLGYVTMALIDTVYNYLANILGKNLLVDHAFLNFWRIAHAVYGWTDFTNGQRCAGDKDSHQLSFEYFYQYAEAYKDNNKFAYVHLHAAHETSGNIRTVDKDIVPFLEKFFGLMIERDENFVFILMSDHGVKYMFQHMWDIRTFYESNDSIFEVFMSKEVEKQWNLTEILKHNVKSVVDRFDINLSLKDIAYFPYKDQRSTYYDYYKENYSKKGVSSFFYEKISWAKTCNDILTTYDCCLCKKLVDIDFYDENSTLMLIFIKKLIAKYFDLQSEREPECKNIGEFEVTQSKKFKITENKRGGDTIYYLEIKTEENFDAEVMVRFTLPSKIESSGQILPEEFYPFEYFRFRNRIIFLQIASVDVLNAKCSKNCLC
jgi:hypothetical protein